MDEVELVPLQIGVRKLWISVRRYNQDSKTKVCNKLDINCINSEATGASLIELNWLTEHQVDEFSMHVDGYMTMFGLVSKVPA